MSLHHSSSIEFPTAGSQCRLNKVKVTAYRDSHNQTKAILFERSAEVKQILFMSQTDENINDLQIDIKIQFEDQNFIGTSYSLALAIANKQARLGEADTSKRIVATGILGPNCSIQAVEGFEQKLSLISQSLAANDLFIYPKVNIKSNLSLLEQVEQLPCQTLAITNLSELSHLWAAAQHDRDVNSAPDNAARFFFRGILYGVFSVLMISIAMVLFR